MNNDRTIADLRERVAKLTGSDREIDAALDCAFRFPHLRPWRAGDHAEYGGGKPGDIWCPTGFLMANRYTSSVDDLLELMRERMPDWWGEVGKTHKSFASEAEFSAGLVYWATIRGEPGEYTREDGFPELDIPEQNGAGPTPALALLNALLAALAKEPTTNV